VRSPAAVVAALVVAGWCAASAGVAHAEPEPEPAPPPPAPKTSIDADGIYAVGIDIVPGTYTTEGPILDGACYWKRVNGSELLDNALTKKPQTVVIEPTDTAFTTNDCQPWQMTDVPPPPEPTPSDLLGQLGSFIGRGILSGAPR
jgi:hypothetical protein